MINLSMVYGHVFGPGVSGKLRISPKKEERILDKTDTEVNCDVDDVNNKASKVFRVAVEVMRSSNP